MIDEQRATRDIDSLHRWAQRLRRFAEETDALTVDVREREAFPLEWDNAMDLLDDVQAAAGHGTLSARPLQQLKGVAGELFDLMPVMERLRLRVPDQIALAHAAGRPITSRTA